MTPGSRDQRHQILIFGDELRERKRCTYTMVEAFGLDTKIDSVRGSARTNRRAGRRTDRLAAAPRIERQPNPCVVNFGLEGGRFACANGEFIRIKLVVPVCPLFFSLPPAETRSSRSPVCASGRAGCAD